MFGTSMDSMLKLLYSVPLIDPISDASNGCQNFSSPYWSHDASTVGPNFNDPVLDASSGGRILDTLYDPVLDAINDAN